MTEGEECSKRRVVIHIDVDSFFVQVEALKDPSLRGIPVAVQQHQDIIALSYEARRLGLTKHCTPAEARRALLPLGGRVVHVYTKNGRVSYRPYMDVSRQLFQVLRQHAGAAIIEKASIDEAYIELSNDSPLCTNGEGGCPRVSSALRVASSLRRAVRESLGLEASAGCGHNKLMARFASGAAKPSGEMSVCGPSAISSLLSRTPAHRLPGFGSGPFAAFLTSTNITSVTDLARHLNNSDTNVLDGVGGVDVVRVRGWCRGECNEAVVVKGPPGRIGVQMTLTPEPRPAHPQLLLDLPPGRASGAGAEAMLQPMRANETARLRSLLLDMAVDLVERVEEDAEEHGRWPQTLTLTIRIHGPNSRLGSRSVAFPQCTANKDGQALAQSIMQSALVQLHAYAMGEPDGKVTQIGLVGTRFAAIQARSSTLSQLFTSMQANNKQSGNDDNNMSNHHHHNNNNGNIDNTINNDDDDNNGGMVKATDTMQDNGPLDRTQVEQQAQQQRHETQPQPRHQQQPHPQLVEPQVAACIEALSFEWEQDSDQQHIMLQFEDNNVDVLTDEDNMALVQCGQQPSQEADLPANDTNNKEETTESTQQLQPQQLQPNATQLQVDHNPPKRAKVAAVQLDDTLWQHPLPLLDLLRGLASGAYGPGDVARQLRRRGKGIGRQMAVLLAEKGDVDTL